MKKNILKNLTTPEDTIYFLKETFKVQSEMLDYFVDLEEGDRLKIVAELRELENNVQEIAQELEREELKTSDENDEESKNTKTEPPLGLLFDFGRLRYMTDYSEIDDFVSDFHAERDKRVDEYEEQKIEESKINNEIKEYLIAKKKLVQNFQKKVKNIDVLVKKLLSQSIKLNSEEKVFIIYDTLRILKNITEIRLKYTIDKKELAKKIYRVFKEIHDYFLKLSLDDEEIRFIDESSPLFDELPFEDENNEEIDETILKKFVQSRPKMLLKSSILPDQLLLAVELRFADYQSKLKKVLKCDENSMFRSISLYERIKEKYESDIKSLFIEKVSHILNESPAPEYAAINEWKFDFIIHEEFRQVIERDFAELKINLSSGCLKSSLVLMGAILEAILFDLFYENDDLIRKKFEKEYPKRKYLYSHIRVQFLAEAAKELGIINDDLKKMCELIWRLRNNVHSMKEITGLRVTKENVDATVPLMTMVLRNLNRNISGYLNAIQERVADLKIEMEDVTTE